MKNSIPLLLLVILTSLLFVGGCSQIKFDWKEYIIGTWTTEDGAEKLVISEKSLIYTDKDVGIERTCTYATMGVDFEEEKLYLEPTKDNDSGLLGSYEKIEYRDGKLFGGILISDEGYYEVEFRKEW